MGVRIFKSRTLVIACSGGWDNQSSADKKKGKKRKNSLEAQPPQIRDLDVRQHELRTTEQRSNDLHAVQGEV